MVKRIVRALDTYFVSFDGKDRNIAMLIVESLRRNNRDKRFFWAGDSLAGGKGWFGRIENALGKARGIVCLITNNQSGTNNWINLELGAAIGGDKHRMIIIGPGVAVPGQLSRALQELQYIGWSDRKALRRELIRSGLTSSKSAVEELVSAMEPPRIRGCTYGEGENWYTYSAVERGRFATLLENQQQLIIGNHFIGNNDPSLGNPKVLRIEVERAGTRYVREVEEGALLNRGDLW